VPSMSYHQADVTDGREPDCQHEQATQLRCRDHRFPAQVIAHAVRLYFRSCCAPLWRRGICFSTSGLLSHLSIIEPCAPKRRSQQRGMNSKGRGTHASTPRYLTMACLGLVSPPSSPRAPCPKELQAWPSDDRTYRAPSSFNNLTTSHRNVRVMINIGEWKNLF
jgi:hypothetical protein